MFHVRSGVLAVIYCSPCRGWAGQRTEGGDPVVPDGCLCPIKEQGAAAPRGVLGCSRAAAVAGCEGDALKRRKKGKKGV